MSLLDFVGDYSLGSDSPNLSAGLGDFYDYGAIDQGAFDIPNLTLPDWSGGGGGSDGGSAISNFAGPAIKSLYDFGGDFPNANSADLPFAGGEPNYQFDTSSGEVVGPGGQRQSVDDYLKQATPGERAGFAATAGGGAGGAGPGQPNGTGGGGILGGVNDFLGSNFGRLAAAGLIGAGGLGAARLAAGPAPRLNLPTYTPAPATLAGQEAVLNAMRGGAGGNLTGILQTGTAGENLIAQQLAARAGRESASETIQAPGQEMIRGQAQGQIPGLLTPNVADPVLEAIRAELLGTLNNPQGGVSPATVQRQQQEEAQVRNELLQRLGRDYELTTAGGQALNQMQQRHNIERFTERQATIANLTPLEQGALAAQSGRQQTGLTNSAAFSQFGIRGVPENLTGLERLAPSDTLLGGDPNQANLINTNLANTQAIQGFNAANQERQGVSAGIAGLSGTIAGQVASRPSRYEDSMAQLIDQQTGTGMMRRGGGLSPAYG